MRPLILLRPEPGASDSATQATALGMKVIREPLFELVQVAWRVPELDQFDGLLLTSANAMLFGGPKLELLRKLPVRAVGAATAEAASAAGFSVASIGGAGVDVLLAGLPRGISLLHLSGADRRPPQAHGAHLVPLTVYRATALEPGEGFHEMIKGAVVAIHSRRAGERLAKLVEERAATALVAISADATAGTGAGWEQIAVAERPSDAALLATAAALCL
ncbi:MAG: uroporphyrinogen-III synthase [Pseudomonadota bacterium]|nr:uroporphyrinogen-III synthase [Pseudomonadota bacterium]